MGSTVRGASGQLGATSFEQSLKVTVRDDGFTVSAGGTRIHTVHADEITAIERDRSTLRIEHR